MTPVPAKPVSISDFVYETFSSLMMISSYDVVVLFVILVHSRITND